MIIEWIKQTMRLPPINQKKGYVNNGHDNINNKNVNVLVSFSKGTVHRKG